MFQKPVQYITTDTICNLGLLNDKCGKANKKKKTVEISSKRLSSPSTEQSNVCAKPNIYDDGDLTNSRRFRGDDILWIE